jgi:hypothetical protein
MSDEETPVQPRSVPGKLPEPVRFTNLPPCQPYMIPLNAPTRREIRKLRGRVGMTTKKLLTTWKSKGDLK